MLMYLITNFAKTKNTGPSIWAHLTLKIAFKCVATLKYHLWNMHELSEYCVKTLNFFHKQLNHIYLFICLHLPLFIARHFNNPCWYFKFNCNGNIKQEYLT